MTLLLEPGFLSLLAPHLSPSHLGRLACVSRAGSKLLSHNEELWMLASGGLTRTEYFVQLEKTCCLCQVRKHESISRTLPVLKRSVCARCLSVDQHHWKRYVDAENEYLEKQKKIELDAKAFAVMKLFVRLNMAAGSLGDVDKKVRLAYSSVNNGCALSTLLTRCSKLGCCILLIELGNKMKIGAFFTQTGWAVRGRVVAIQKSNIRLFRIFENESNAEVFAPQGDNVNIFCDGQSLGIGGVSSFHPIQVFDGMMRCASFPSVEFPTALCPVEGENKLEIRSAEVWSLEEERYMRREEDDQMSVLANPAFNVGRFMLQFTASAQRDGGQRSEFE